ncbi:MAG TPA: glycosyltransferase [Solirubrobacteraceae bacterium]|jgi:glycosyltransferase involved in cell wall biosynthesis|nr:glycosyltransferase [Solirubrobacteraceae bacterium]
MRSHSPPAAPTEPADAAGVGVAGSAGEVGGVRTAVVGMSVGETCGVHDHAVLLADALSNEGISSSMHWLWRQAESPRAARSEIRAFTRKLALDLDERHHDAVLLHYSVFSYAYRGVPVFVGPTLAALRRSPAPVIPIMHEFVYPWTHGGWRGKLWAVSQRAALIGVMRAAGAVVVTTDYRARWLATRRWLAQREVLVAPVFSNLPPPVPDGAPGQPSPSVGLFGYSSEEAVPLVLDAADRLLERGRGLRLVLLGAPGRASSAGEMWLAAAARREMQERLSFSGVLPAQSLSNALAACDVLLFTDSAGPSPRKGTLAASLASGSPVVAVDGPQLWSKLVESDALEVVQPTSEAMAGALDRLLADEDRRRALGARGRAFAEQQMGLARSVAIVRELIGELVNRSAS